MVRDVTVNPTFQSCLEKVENKMEIHSMRTVFDRALQYFAHAKECSQTSEQKQLNIWLVQEMYIDMKIIIKVVNILNISDQY